MSRGARTATVAWLITATYYFYQYALRSAPAVEGFESFRQRSREKGRS